MTIDSIDQAIIIGGLNPKHVVEKSRPLMLLKNAPFTLEELKVLDTYLSRINARDVNHRTVRFSKSEYEELMNLQQVRPEQIKKYIEKLYNTEIELTDESKPGWSDSIKLFSRRRTYQDKSGRWWVELSCTPEAKEYFFSVDNLGYFGYYLGNIVNLVSMYSYSLYMYVLMQSYRRKWEVDVDRLKDILDCTSERYKEFKFFNSEILKKAAKEVNEKTDLKFSYEVVKEGRKVKRIEFKVLDVVTPRRRDLLPDVEELLEAEPLDEEDFVPLPEENEDPLDFFAEALPDGLSRDQIAYLKDEAIKHLPDPFMMPGERDIWVYDYLRSKAKLMKAQNKPVHSNAQFSWLKRAVEEDWS